MNTVTVGPHTVTIHNTEMTLDSDQFSLRYEKTGSIQTVYLSSSGTTTKFEILACKARNNSLQLNHLEIPSQYRGNNLGKLAIAIFYYLLQQSQYSQYSIKFGGGEKSAAFLRNLGFPQHSIETGQDIDSDKSVMVGEFISHQQGSVYDWTLRPVHISTFPTEFFELR